MVNCNFMLRITKLGIAFLILCSVIYTVFKTNQSGSDINLYLKASKQLFSGQTMYYGKYYNSPLFAMCLYPLQYFKSNISWVVWGLLNLFLAWSFFRTISRLLRQYFILSEKEFLVVMGCSILVILGSINFNLMLGQVTILLLWLVIQAVYQFTIGRGLVASLLLALAINIKVFPILFLFVLLVFRQIRYIALCFVFIGIFVLLPSFFIGWEDNVNVHLQWLNSINPFTQTMVVECYYGSISITGWVPLYIHSCGLVEHYHGSREIHVLSLNASGTMQVLSVVRILGLLVIMSMGYMAAKMKPTAISVLFMLGLVSLAILVFMPHQHKYSELLIYLPGMYFILRAVEANKIGRRYPKKQVYNYFNYLTLSVLLFIAIMGRDIIGDSISDVLDTWGILGILNLYLFCAICILNPWNSIPKEFVED